MADWTGLPLEVLEGLVLLSGKQENTGSEGIGILNEDTDLLVWVSDKSSENKFIASSS